MSSPYQILLRGPQSLKTLRSELKEAIKESQASITVYTLDSEDIQDAQKFFEIEPTLGVDLQTSRDGTEGKIFAALLGWAESHASIELVVLLDYEMIMSFRNGALLPAAGEQEFFEREVQPYRRNLNR